MEVKKENSKSPSWSQLFTGFIILILVGIFGTFISFLLMRIPTSVSGASLGARKGNNDNSMTPDQCFFNETLGMENWVPKNVPQEAASIGVFPYAETNVPTASIPFFAEGHDRHNHFDKKLLVDKLYTEICTDTSIPSANKPSKLTLGYSNDLKPISCVHEPFSDQCRQDLKTYDNFNLKIKRTGKLKHAKKRDDIFDTLIKETESLLYLLETDEQINAYNRLMITTAILKNSDFTSQYLHDNKDKDALVCVDINGLAASKLLKNQSEHDLSMKIQFVAVSFTKNSHTEDHFYVLLDSNCEDVTITEDRAQVKKILKNIKGRICDPWNAGWYKRYETDDSGYYKDTPWNSLTIQTLSLNPIDFDILPKEIQNYFCKLLSDIGFDINLRSATSSRCRSMK